MNGMDCSGLVSRSVGYKTHAWSTKSGNPPGRFRHVNVRTNSFNNFISDVIRGDLFLWRGHHAAFYSGDGVLFHAHGMEGTPTGFSYDLNNYWIPSHGYPNVYRQY